MAESTLRIAMTAADIPTATGLPNNGFEGMRFLGYPIFEGLVLWDLTRTDKLATCVRALPRRWEQDPEDTKTWIFHLRHGVKFHDGTDFNADAVIWNLDRYFNKDSAQFEPPSAAMSRARVPMMGSYKKIDDFTVAITTTQAGVLFSLHGGLSAVHFARLVREGRPRLGQGRHVAGGRHRAVPDHQDRAAAVGRSGPLGRVLGCRQNGEGRQGPADADPGGEYAARRAAVGAGRLDRGAAA